MINESYLKGFITDVWNDGNCELFYMMNKHIDVADKNEYISELTSLIMEKARDNKQQIIIEDIC